MDKAKRHRPADLQLAPLAKVWLEPQDGRVRLLVVDARGNDSKQFLIGEGIASDGDIEASLTPQGVLDHFCKAGESDRGVAVVELAHKERIGPRLAPVFAAARSGAAITLLCRDSGIMDIIDGLLDLLDRQPQTTPPYAQLDRHTPLTRLSASVAGDG
jgi:hypothetical protein